MSISSGTFTFGVTVPASDYLGLDSIAGQQSGVDGDFLCIQTSDIPAAGNSIFTADMNGFECVITTDTPHGMDFNIGHIYTKATAGSASLSFRGATGSYVLDGFHMDIIPDAVDVINGAGTWTIQNSIIDFKGSNSAITDAAVSQTTIKNNVIMNCGGGTYGAFRYSAGNTTNEMIIEHNLFIDCVKCITTHRIYAGFVKNNSFIGSTDTMDIAAHTSTAQITLVNNLDDSTGSKTVAAVDALGSGNTDSLTALTDMVQSLTTADALWGRPKGLAESGATVSITGLTDAIDVEWASDASRAHLQADVASGTLSNLHGNINILLRGGFQ